MIRKENDEMRKYSDELDAKIAENNAILAKQKETRETIDRNRAPYRVPALHARFNEKKVVEIKTFLDKLMHRLYYFPPEIQGEKSLEERSAKLKTKAQREQHLTVAENMIEDWVRGQSKRNAEKKQHEKKCEELMLKLMNQYPDLDFEGKKLGYTVNMPNPAP